MPSEDNISKFHLTLGMSARVESALQVCEDGIDDVAAVARNEIQVRLLECARHHPIEDIHSLRSEIAAFLGNSMQLESGIRLSNFSIQLEADQVYTEYAKDRRKLTYTKHLEEERAAAARAMAEQYSDPVTRSFREFVTGAINAEEAAQRIRENSSEDYNEMMRRIDLALDAFKKVGDQGFISPVVLEERASQLFGLLFGKIGLEISPEAAGHARQTLGERSDEEALYAPPED